MKLLPGVEAVIKQSQAARANARPTLIHRLDLPLASAEVRLITTGAEAEQHCAELAGAPVDAIALDSEFGFDRPGIELGAGKDWHDIRSQRPICVSIAAWCRDTPREGGGYILRSVLDVRQEGVAAALGTLLRLRVPLIFHHAKPDLFSLWALGLDPTLPTLYDTYVAAAALELGLHHKRAKAGQSATEVEEIRLAEEVEDEQAHRLSLIGQCSAYGIAYPFTGSKAAMRDRFLNLESGAALGEEEASYAAADAEATLKLYLEQQPKICQAGIASHLYQVEFPFTVANARMEWNGVWIERSQMERVRVAADRARAHYSARLLERGIDPPGSRDKFLGLMEKDGLLEHFQRGKKLSTEKDFLETIEHLHPAIREFRLHKRYQRLAGEEWLRGVLVGADGRTHPSHRQLGAATGRNTCSAPNIVGVGRVLRPIVTAPPGRALIELDYGQIEVGVAAAEFDDPDLVAAFNSGDVYSAMAQRLYAGELSTAERGLDSKAFKKARPDLRERTKVFVLAVMYGMQAGAIAGLLQISETQAEEERCKFLDSYPALSGGIESAIAAGVSRGYARIVGGLRRHIEKGASAGSWIRNTLRNTPIQGSAAVVFKTAIVRLDQAFADSDVKLVLPIHDAVLIECRAEDVETVAACAKTIMEDALRAYYPALVPKVEVNKARPECWNKDGKADSLDRLLEDPEFQIDAPQAAEVVPEWVEGEGRASSSQDHAQLVAEMQRMLGWSALDVPELSAVWNIWLERFEERAAIAEFDGGRPRPLAEAVARASVLAEAYQCLQAAAVGQCAVALVGTDGEGGSW